MTTDHLSTIGLLGLDPEATLPAALAQAGRRLLVLGRADDPRAGEAQLVVQAGEEDPARAAELFAALGAAAPDALLVTTSATLAITALAAATRRPERVAGLHLFSTGPGDRSVEVVRARQTSPQTVESLVALVRAADKVPVVTKDRPGRLLNALFVPYLNDVIAELDDGLASAEDIDVALQLGLGYQVGPLALLDRTGLDQHLRLTRALHAASHDPRYAPPPLLREMVAAGDLGDATGSGFRTHPEQETT